MKLRTLLAVSALAAMLSSVPAYAVTPASGYCGEGGGSENTVSWSVDANGVLTISGEWTPSSTGFVGYMQNFLREPNIVLNKIKKKKKEVVTKAENNYLSRE